MPPCAAVHDGAAVIPASYNANRMVEIGDKHQGHTVNLAKLVVRPATT